MITLRPYQHECVERGLHFFKSDKIQKPKIIVAPTAAGKSIIIAAIAAKLEGNVLVLQPSLELLEQNYSKFCLYENHAEIYSASAGKKNIGKVTFATIGSIVKVADIFSEFTALIIDEAHLYPPGQESMFGKFLKQNPQLKILGLTATPFRLKTSQELGAKLVMMHNSNIYNGYCHIIQIQEISKDFWCPLEYVVEEVNDSGLKINTTGAEYTDQSLISYGLSVDQKVMNEVEKYPEKSKLVFVPSVKQAAILAQRTGGAYVCADTDKRERKQIISDFRSGKIKTVFNVNVLSVGFDYPELEMIIDACPTLSLARHYQKVGRLTRPHPNKKLGIVIDLSGNTERFGRVEDIELKKIGTTYHIFSGEKQLSGVYFGEVLIKKPVSFIPKKFKDMELTFGKFKGNKISEAPDWYLSWCMDNINWNRELVGNIRLFLDQKKSA